MHQDLTGLEISGNWCNWPRTVSIDLGGIGKGLAADLVADELIAAGATSAYVSMGGDIHASGEPVDGDGWQVPLLHPISGAVIDHHALFAGAIVMSTVAIRRWTTRRHRAPPHHRPSNRVAFAGTDLIAVAVADQSAARGEALAKAAIIAGSAEGITLLRAADVKAWLITAEHVEVVEEWER